MSQHTVSPICPTNHSTVFCPTWTHCLPSSIARRRDRFRSCSCNRAQCQTRSAAPRIDRRSNLRMRSHGRSNCFPRPCCSRRANGYATPFVRIPPSWFSSHFHLWMCCREFLTHADQEASFHAQSCDHIGHGWDGSDSLDFPQACLQYFNYSIAAFFTHLGFFTGYMCLCRYNIDAFSAQTMTSGRTKIDAASSVVNLGRFDSSLSCSCKFKFVRIIQYS